MTMRRVAVRVLQQVVPAGRVGSASLSLRPFTSIPVIDISSLVKPAKEQTHSDTAKQIEASIKLHKAAKNVGFFYVENSGVPESLKDDVLAQSKAWFDLPESTKQAIALSHDTHYRGYQAMGSNVTRHEGGFTRDQHEALDFYKAVSPDTLPYSAIHGPNQWPTHVPGLKDTLQEYTRRMLLLGRGVMSGLALGLGEPQRLPGEPPMSEDSYWSMRLIHYPPLSEGDSQEGSSSQVDRSADSDKGVSISCGEHCDYGLLTFVNQQQGVTALQVRNRRGMWIDAPPKPGTFVCNVGDMLRVMTNGLYEPTPHRVINSNPGQSRISAAFFYEPRFESTVRPADHFLRTSGSKPNLEGLKYGEHLEKKVFSNFELEY